MNANPNTHQQKTAQNLLPLSYRHYQEKREVAVVGNGVNLNNQRERPYKIYLKHLLSPGDTLCATTCIASLHKAYPGQYLVGADMTWGGYIFYGNPGVTLTRNHAHQSHIAELHYNAIHEVSRRDVSFMTAFHEHLAGVIGRPLPVLVTKPQLFLTPHEQSTRVPGTEHLGEYVVLNSGAKSDYPTKTAGRHIWQSVVNALKDRITFVQVGEANTSHIHPPIAGAVNLIGQTTPRQLFQLVQHSVSACGPVSLLLHVAAALDRPYVCTGGGRESASWVAYESTQYLHCNGALSCAKPGGCWKSFVTEEQAKGRTDKVCTLPVLAPDGEIVPVCHQLASGVNGERIIEAIKLILDAKGK